MLSVADWHRRFEQQAGWTDLLRQHLFSQVSLSSNDNILEVGCGTGAITRRLHSLSPARLIGADVDFPRLRFAAVHDGVTHFMAADGLRLPFAPASFDLTVCHFYLLWVTDPLQAICEMRRVTRPGGTLAMLAEPDYGSRIDFPTELVRLGQLQTHALKVQGANPFIGRQLASLLEQAGVTSIQGGMLNRQPAPAFDPVAFDLEWQVIEADLANDLSPTELAALKSLDREAHLQGTRVLFVPTFYAWGIVPDAGVAKKRLH
ncbi:MAG: methyltransferase domain-containing protein [Anaerolineaceae bacterium]|jgi:SAM-dependent methyltransferase